MSNYFPWPPYQEFPDPNASNPTPPGEGSNPVEGVPISQEAMAESETRLTGATPYAIIDETSAQKEDQQEAKQNAPFNDPSIFTGAADPSEP